MGKTRKCHPNCLCAGRLWAVYRRTPSDAARNAVVEFYLPLLRSIAKRQARILHRELDDVLSDGAIGLMSAVETFQCGTCMTFQGVAKRHINHAIIDAVRAVDHSRNRIVFISMEHIDPISPRHSDTEYLDDLVSQLCPVDQTLVYYLRQGMTQKEIGQQIGVGQAAISHRVRKIIRKMRGLIHNSGFVE